MTTCDTIPHALDKVEEHHYMSNFEIAARVIRGIAKPTDKIEIESNRDRSRQGLTQGEGSS